MEVLHENSKGIRIVREDSVRRSKVRVLNENNHALRTYRFNNQPFYEHPLLSWANLDCCNGWPHDEEYLLTAVQEGKKPVADILADELPEIKEAADCEVWHDPDRNWQGKEHVLIARKASLKELFSLDEIAEVYTRHGIRVGGLALQPYFSVPLIELFQKDFWVTPSTAEELIITGLGLGYPIESTASILCGY